VAAGFAVNVALLDVPTMLDPDHVYEVTPLADSVPVEPLQMAVGVVVIVGLETTVIAVVAVPVHPAADVPVTV
jgi:hypothetical protein